MKQIIVCRSDLHIERCNYFAIYSSDSSFHRKRAIATIYPLFIVSTRLIICLLLRPIIKWDRNDYFSATIRNVVINSVIIFGVV